MFLKQIQIGEIGFLATHATLKTLPANNSKMNSVCTPCVIVEETKQYFWTHQQA